MFCSWYPHDCWSLGSRLHSTYGQPWEGPSCEATLIRDPKIFPIVCFYFPWFRLRQNLQWMAMHSSVIITEYYRNHQGGCSWAWSLVVGSCCGGCRLKTVTNPWLWILWEGEAWRALGRVSDVERSVLNIDDPRVLQAVSKLVSYCHQVFVLFGHFDPHKYCTPWASLVMGSCSHLEETVGYCIILGVWYRRCFMWRKMSAIVWLCQ